MNIKQTQKIMVGYEILGKSQRDITTDVHPIIVNILPLNYNNHVKQRYVNPPVRVFLQLLFLFGSKK